VRRYICKRCGTAHARWSARCLSCTAYNLEPEAHVASPPPIAPTVSGFVMPPVAAPVMPRPLQAAQAAQAAQEELPRLDPVRPHLSIVRSPPPDPDPDPDLSPEELADVLPPSSPMPVPITAITESLYERDSTGLPPVDYVLGGGLVPSSVVLLASPPGVGKSSLTLQVLVGLGYRCLYVTGEETCEQVAGTAQRIGAMSDNLLVLAESDLTKIFAHARAVRAQMVAVDSIQKMHCTDISGRPGSPSQVKEATDRLVKFAKKKNGPAVWIIGHVTGEGDIAGPKTIEHDVDVVLELSQGAKYDGNERRLRCSGKNRFGPTNLVGEFELTSTGLKPVDADGWDEKL
jgi:predicted ATP-dependent serine protease